jgi:hypothetical protein
VRRADNLTHLHVPNVLKSRSLNLLEPSGPVMGLLYLLHSVCIICMYINVCIHMHTHTANYDTTMFMDLASSYIAWILGNVTVRMSILADLCMLSSTLKWWEANDFLCYWPSLLLNQETKCLRLSFSLASKEDTIKDFVSFAGVPHVSHLCIFNSTELGTHMRVARLPPGPTLTFQVHNTHSPKTFRQCRSSLCLRSYTRMCHS